MKMDKRKESIADIVAEMRMGSPVNPGAYRIGLPDKITVLECGDKMRTIQIKTVTVKELADRIEAAAKREKAQLGNSAAMREALEVCLDFIMRLDRAFNPFMQNMLENAIAKSNASLSAPPRNCDVGTAEEQAKRFGKVCGKYYNEEEQCNEKCPLASLDVIHGFPRCQAYWAQMPYE